MPPTGPIPRRGRTGVPPARAWPRPDLHLVLRGVVRVGVGRNVRIGGALGRQQAVEEKARRARIARRLCHPAQIGLLNAHAVEMEWEWGNGKKEAWGELQPHQTASIVVLPDDWRPRFDRP